MTPAPVRSASRRAYQKTGVFALKRALKRRGLAALAGRSSLARSVAEWRDTYAHDLGGDLSTGERTLLDAACGHVAMLTVIDGTLGAHPEWIVNRRKRCLAPLVKERLAVVSSLKDLLVTLGLKRMAKPVPSLAELLARRAGEPAMVQEPSGETTEAAS
jgi:hypothetical protein